MYGSVSDSQSVASVVCDLLRRDLTIISVGLTLRLTAERELLKALLHHWMLR